MQVHRVVVAAVVVWIGAAAWGQCSPRFEPGYDYGRLRFTSTSAFDTIFCSAVFDDHSGTGPCLFIGGYLTVLGDQGGSWMAKLVGDQWVAIAGFDGPVRCLKVVDEGSGPVLYVGGSFTTFPGGGSGALARWNGTTWDGLGVSLFGLGGDDGVYCVARHDDGSGMGIFAGGIGLSVSGDSNPRFVVRNSGDGWGTIDGGLWDSGNVQDPLGVRGMIVFDDGSGPHLFVCGSFNTVANTTAYGVAIWNGSYWSGSGYGLSDASMKALAIHPFNGAPALFVAGELGFGGSQTAVWRRDGQVWTPVLSNSGDFASGVGAGALLSYDDGTGPALYATVGRDAHTCSEVWRLGASGWAAMGQQFTIAGGATRPYLAALAVVPGLQGTRMVVTGRCSTSGSTPTPNAAAWNGSAWTAVEPVGIGNPVSARVVFDPETDDGSVYTGSRRYVAGGWTPTAYPVAGANWMLRLHQGGVSNLVVLGSGFAINNGGGWQPIPGLTQVLCLGIATDTGEETLVAASGSSLPYTVYRRVGTNWASLGSPVSGSSLYLHLNRMACYDSGGGPKLYIGGVTGASESGTPTSYLAYLDQGHWTAVPNVPGQVMDMCVYDVGSGPELILACTPDGVIGPAGGGVYRWNGSRVASVGPGLGNAYATSLLRFDDGGGPRLWVSCSSSDLGAVAFWNGSSWQSPAGMVNVTGGVTSMAPALRSDRSHSLMIAGGLMNVGDIFASGIAELATCPRTCTADFNGDGDAGTDADIEAFFACLAGTCCAQCGSADFNNDGDTATDSDIESFFRVIAGGAC
jgi:hypothetical protein